MEHHSASISSVVNNNTTNNSTANTSAVPVTKRYRYYKKDKPRQLQNSRPILFVKWILLNTTITSTTIIAKNKNDDDAATDMDTNTNMNMDMDILHDENTASNNPKPPTPKKAMTNHTEVKIVIMGIIVIREEKNGEYLNCHFLIILIIIIKH